MCVNLWLLHLKLNFNEKILPSFEIDVVYIMGGNTEPGAHDGQTYEVITVDLKSGDVGEAEDTLKATSAPAAASSLNRIALCGGRMRVHIEKYCQVYSPKEDKYVQRFAVGLS